ncbi:unnamed protein product [Moneuplotes crassus]|uniref:RING-type domain-containing protein n=1 Tax=Euplotes crassus TaxID=5936 RepID=A0AAD1U321_EUPCR|nr:unnamed protein product [Moneuplotes crassus]
MSKKHLDADDTKDATWLAREIGKFNGNLDRGMAFLLGANFQKFGKKYGRDAYTQLATILERALSDMAIGKNQMNQVYKELYEQECLSDCLELPYFKEYKKGFIKTYETPKPHTMSDDDENSTEVLKSQIQTPSETLACPTTSEKFLKNAAMSSSFNDRSKETKKFTTSQENLEPYEHLNEEEPENSEQVLRAFNIQGEEHIPYSAENSQHIRAHEISDGNSIDSEADEYPQYECQVDQNPDGEQITYKRMKTGEEHEAHIELQDQKVELEQRLSNHNPLAEDSNDQHDDPMESHHQPPNEGNKNQETFDVEEFTKKREMKEQLRFAEQDQLNKDGLDVYRRSNSEEHVPLKKIATQPSNLPKGINDIRHIPDVNAQAQLLDEHNQEFSDPDEAEIIEKTFREQEFAKKQQDAFEEMQRKLEQERKDKEVADQLQNEERIKVQQQIASSICELCNRAFGDSEVVQLSCEDIFHPSCFQNYVEYKVKVKNYPITCPGDKCREKVTYSELKALLNTGLYNEIEKDRMREYLPESEYNYEDPTTTQQSNNRNKRDSKYKGKHNQLKKKKDKERKKFLGLF